MKVPRRARHTSEAEVRTFRPDPAWAEEFVLPIAVLDTDGGYVWRNARWVELDPITGVPFVWSLDFVERLRAVVERHQTSVLRAQRHREREAWYDLWLAPVEDERLVWVVATDVTLYETAAAQELMEHRIREASVMIQGVLHETRNPLSGIKATVQLLQRGAVSDPERHLKQILADISRIDVVLQELTLLAGPLRLHRAPTNLHALLDEVIQSLRHQAETEGVDFERFYDPSLPELAVDPHRMYRVFLNLLRNAVEASPPRANVEVRTRSEFDRRLNQQAWVIEIRDHGPGLDPETERLLFTPMFTTKPTGTGLGLAVSQQIVQAHGGLVTLANHPEGGAVARVSLPLERDGGSRTERR